MRGSPTLRRTTALVSILWAVAGCSPHPAAGTWVADAAAPFARLEVTFEGWAELYAPGETEAGRRCFWAAEGPRVAAISCKLDPHAEESERYRLEVSEGGDARLARLDGGGEVTRLSRAE